MYHAPFARALLQRQHVEHAQRLACLAQALADQERPGLLVHPANRRINIATDLDVPLQTNSKDCALHALKAVELFSRPNRPPIPALPDVKPPRNPHSNIQVSIATEYRSGIDYQWHRRHMDSYRRQVFDQVVTEVPMVLP